MFQEYVDFTRYYNLKLAEAAGRRQTGWPASLHTQMFTGVQMFEGLSQMSVWVNTPLPPYSTVSRREFKGNSLFMKVAWWCQRTVCFSCSCCFTSFMRFEELKACSILPDMAAVSWRRYFKVLNGFTSLHMTSLVPIQCQRPAGWNTEGWSHNLHVHVTMDRWQIPSWGRGGQQSTWTFGRKHLLACCSLWRYDVSENKTCLQTSCSQGKCIICCF